MNIYDFYITLNNGELISLEAFKGKVLLIFNSSPLCYLSDYYKDIQSTYHLFKRDGLEIIDFPSDTFTNLSSYTEEEIETEIQKRYKTSFLRTKRISLQDNIKEPLFSFLEFKTKFQGFYDQDPFTTTLIDIVKKRDPYFQKNSKIKWNFTFFIIDRTGNIVKRYEPTTPFSRITKAINRIL